MGLPVLGWLEENGNKVWWATFWRLCGLSAMIQFGGVLIADSVYLEGLYAQTLQPVTELILWRLRYAPWLGHWMMVLQGGKIDLAAWRVFQMGNVWVLAVWMGMAVLVAGCAAALRRVESKGASREMWIAACALVCTMLVLIGVSMHHYRQDPAWHAEREDLAAAVEMVEEGIQDGDGVVVSPYLYPVWYYAMNEARFGVSWYSWPVPGDEVAAEQAMAGFIPLAERYERAWLIEQGVELPTRAQFRETFALMETRRFGEDVWVSVYVVE